MAQNENNAYILGTERAELHRLGLQHQVWALQARKAWNNAGFTNGMTILDLGCGPGFCTRDLAYIVGEKGKVIGIDRSAIYLDFLNKTNDLHQLNIETQLTDFDEMVLDDNSLDGVYCRWALAWIPNPEEIVSKVVRGMKKGATFAVQEYYDWAMFQTEPHMPNLQKGIYAAFESFERAEGMINIGRRLPQIFEEAGLEVISTRPMTTMTTPDSISWHWPKSFLNIYLPKMIDLGLLNNDDVKKALDELDELEKNPRATMLCPHMIEVVGRKL